MSEMIERVASAYEDEGRLWHVWWSSLDRRAEVRRAKDLLALDGPYTIHAILKNRDEADWRCDRLRIAAAARAAIEAMREPTEAMCDAGSLAWPSGARYAGGEEAEVWQAMIDEALK